jgi:hypothetical protein
MNLLRLFLAMGFATLSRKLARVGANIDAKYYSRTRRI